MAEGEGKSSTEGENKETDPKGSEGTKGEENDPKKTGEPDFDGDFDEERAKRTIAAVRGDAAAAKEKRKAAEKERDELAAKLKKLEDANKTDEEKREEELERLKSVDTERNVLERKLAVQSAVLELAGEAGITDVALALRAIDPSEIEFDKEGKPENVSDVLKALVERHPSLAADGQEPKPAGTKKTNAKDGANNGDGPALTAEQLEAAKRLGMTPEDYAKYLDPVAVGEAARAAAAGKGGSKKTED